MNFSIEKAKEILAEVSKETGRTVDYSTKKGCNDYLDAVSYSINSAREKIALLVEPKTFDLSEIENDLKAGKGKDIIEVGCRITFELLNGEPSTIICIGKKHDKGTDGKFVNMTFAFDSCPDGEFPINEVCSNSGGWKDCYMNNVTLKRFFRLLPPTIQELIVPVIKEANNGDDELEIVENKLFLLSVEEYIGDNEDSIEGEGKQYELFKNGYRFTDKKYWWTRSPNANHYSYWNYVYNSGSISNYSVNDTNYVRPCFCIN